jgi:hypothetical protein
VLSRVADTDLGSLVQLVLGYEDDTHAPAAMAAKQSDELDNAEVATVDRDDRLVELDRDGGVGHDLAPKYVAARSPLVAGLEVLDLGLARGISVAT